MELSRFSTPSMVRSPVRGGVMAISRVAGWGLPLNILAMGLNLMVDAPLLPGSAPVFWMALAVTGSKTYVLLLQNP